MANEVLNNPGTEEGQVTTVTPKPGDTPAPVANSDSPRLGYEIVKSDTRSPGEKAAEQDTHHPYLADLNARLRELQKQAPAMKKAKKPVAVSPGQQIPNISKLLENPTHSFAIIGVVLGILVAAAVAAISLHHSVPDGRYDMGTVSSSDAGLTGHLFIRWEKQLEYRLTLEPSSPELHPGFSLTVGNAPRPLAVTINLQDTTGFVLCTTTIVVPFDARRAAELAASNPPGQNGTAAASDASGAAPAVDYGNLAAQEVSREQSNDVFVNQVGPNQQIESISAQGNLSCSKDAYQKAASWSFAPDFLTLAEQTELLKRLTQPKAFAAEQAAEAAADRRRNAPKSTKKPPIFYVEGDDSIVDYDASAGVISTRSGRSFAISKTGADADALKARDLPFEIHYKCGQPGLCVLGGAGGRVTSTAKMIR
jgi:hypothetical protein